MPLAHHYPIESTVRNAILKSIIYHRLPSTHQRAVVPSQPTSHICRYGFTPLGGKVCIRR